ncbi:hypothetical protein GCM10023189_49550 [Nibrella saemangeumensis]|uniref:DUF4249 domain-containing protein n=1 Tax=Nibrella saemangeumensis TaxID=1084526 RepID=A0ABP8NIA0_9BACT
MPVKNWKKIVGWLAILGLGGCVDPYQPTEITAPNNYLVVDGFLNSKPGTISSIRLSRTQNLSDKNTPAAETRAVVTVETEGRATYSFRESGVGVYTLADLVPQPGQQYRLRIKTSRGVEYLSDFTPVVPTPPIDSVSWQPKSDGLQIYVNTHDPRNNTRYYRWEFDETWEYSTPYNSVLELKSGKLVNREESIYRCWASESSKNIQLASSARLSQDVIRLFPLHSIPDISWKLVARYSILVRQYALSQDAYAYWEQLAKMTQNIGSLFDPQPFLLTGNIHCVTNPDEPVLGYFSVGSVETKRIFIRRSELPNWGVNSGYGFCVIDTATSITDLVQRALVPINTLETGGILASDTYCVDCRQRGTNKKPDFWGE